MQDITIREWIDQNADEARAAIMAIENNLDAYSDDALASAQLSMRRIVEVSQRRAKSTRKRRA